MAAILESCEADEIPGDLLEEAANCHRYEGRYKTAEEMAKLPPGSCEIEIMEVHQDHDAFIFLPDPDPDTPKPIASEYHKTCCLTKRHLEEGMSFDDLVLLYKNCIIQQDVFGKEILNAVQKFKKQQLDPVFFKLPLGTDLLHEFVDHMYKIKCGYEDYHAALFDEYWNKHWGLYCVGQPPPLERSSKKMPIKTKYRSKHTSKHLQNISRYISSVPSSSAIADVKSSIIHDLTNL